MRWIGGRIIIYFFIYFSSIYPSIHIVEKEFDAWNIKKKKLEKISKKFFFKTGDIWWCSVGVNVQSESCGKGEEFRRPVLVLKKLSSDSFIGIPLSSKEKIGTWFIDFNLKGEKRFALLYQIRMFSTNRFQRHLSAIDERDFRRIKEKLETLLELSHNHQDESPGSVGIPKSNKIVDDFGIESSSST